MTEPPRIMYPPRIAQKDARPREFRPHRARNVVQPTNLARHTLMRVVEPAQDVDAKPKQP